MSNIQLLENCKSSDDAYRWLSINCNSYTRMEALLSARKRMEWQVFFKTLGLIWTTSDDIAKYKFVLYRVFSNASRYQLDLMMDSKEIKALAQMPEVITIFRGCHPNNRSGLSWTTDKKIATSFTLKNRYQQPGQPRLLLEARIRRENAILMLERNEQEIIAPKVMRPIKTMALD